MNASPRVCRSQRYSTAGAAAGAQPRREPTPRSTVWVGLALAVGYTSVVLVMLAPLTNYSAFSSAIASGDSKLLAWTFAWTSHAILSGLPLFDANIFYPARPALAFAEHHIGVGIWGLPLFALTGNAILVYNVLMVAAPVLNALAMHAFVWRWLRSHWPAAVAGLVFSVSSARLLESFRVQLAWSCWLPLILIALERWTATRRWKWILASAVLVSLQSLATWYLAVMVALAVALFVVWRVAWAMRWWRATPADDGPAPAPTRSLWTMGLQAGIGALLVAAIIWPFARPYVALVGHAEVTPEIAQRYSADAGSYLQPSDKALAGALIERQTGLPARRSSHERSQYLGLLILAMAGIGAMRVAWLALRRRPGNGQDLLWGGYFVLLGSLAVALSFGPSTEGAGMSPFDAISRTSVFGMFRVPSRFAALVTLSAAGLSALGFSLVRHIGRHTTALAGTVLVPLMLFEWAIDPAKVSKPVPDVTPPIYGLVATRNVHALVSLPAYRRAGGLWPLDADYMLYSTTHWRPIVNGYGRTEPPGLHWVVGAVNAFPGVNSAIRMRALGIDHVVLHAARYADGAAVILKEAAASPDFRLVARMGDDYLFEVLPALAR